MWWGLENYQIILFSQCFKDFIPSAVDLSLTAYKQGNVTYMASFQWQNTNPQQIPTFNPSQK